MVQILAADNTAMSVDKAVYTESSDALIRVGEAVAQTGESLSTLPFVGLFSIFLLACFIGYYVVWNVTPALHSPLMSVTNAISSVIIVGAIIAAAPGVLSVASGLGFLAVVLAAVNIFGGFIITWRMLAMFRKKTKPGDKS